MFIRNTKLVNDELTRRATKKNQASTIEKAKRRNNLWSDKEIKMLLNFIESGMTHAEIAVALGRTLYGVTTKVEKLRKAPSIADVPEPPKPTEACILCFVIPTATGQCNCFT